jgi:hypothetical protein
VTLRRHGLRVQKVFAQLFSKSGPFSSHFKTATYSVISLRITAIPRAFSHPAWRDSGAKRE